MAVQEEEIWLALQFSAGSCGGHIWRPNQAVNISGKKGEEREGNIKWKFYFTYYYLKN